MWTPNQSVILIPDINRKFENGWIAFVLEPRSWDVTQIVKLIKSIHMQSYSRHADIIKSSNNWAVVSGKGTGCRLIRFDEI